MDIMAVDELDSACSFDMLFSKNVPGILEKIYFSLDYKSYKNCLEVSNEWKGLLTSERYKTKWKSVFKEGIREDENRLQIVAEDNNSDEARKLLSSGMVDVNSKDEDGLTPLRAAAKKGSKKVAQLLIESGADVNVADKHGETPLHRAAERGHKEIAQLLIESGADVNVVDEGGRTPLYKAKIADDDDGCGRLPR